MGKYEEKHIEKLKRVTNRRDGIGMGTKIELYNDHFQNYKRYAIPKAQLVIADIPYNLGINAYASNPEWYIDGDNKKGESSKAGKTFFDTDNDFRIAEFMHFCSKMLIKEPKEKRKSTSHDRVLCLRTNANSN